MASHGSQRVNKITPFTDPLETFKWIKLLAFVLSSFSSKTSSFQIKETLTNKLRSGSILVGRRQQLSVIYGRHLMPHNHIT